MLFDPLGNAVHTALQWPLVGRDVAITEGRTHRGHGDCGGAACGSSTHLRDGPLGCGLALAKAAGADLVVDVTSGGSLGAAQESLGMVEGFDVGLEMSGSCGARVA